MVIVILSYLSYFIYAIATICIVIYSIFQFNLLLKFYSRIHQNNFEKGKSSERPTITIQLPVYNEKFVIERLIDNIIAFDYPAEKLEIQVLDDSDDETSLIAKEKVAFYRNRGIDINYIHRKERNGYKAGALKEGLKIAKGELIAIFDADFVPDATFLNQVIPYFSDATIGALQTRWQYLNQPRNLLTELQAFQLNVHFTIEQMGRQRGNYFLQFNGTAGIWRKSAIIDAENWQSDTLTEDLDLSYRAQLKGWRIKYLMDVKAPCELPANISGLKSQQFRWMKGGAESAKKLLHKIWLSDIGTMKKLQSSIHLLSSSVFICVFLMGTVSVPLIFLNKYIDSSVYLLTYLLASLPLIAVVFYFANVVILRNANNLILRNIKFIFLFPLFLSLSMGLSFHNFIAVAQGWIGKKTSFIRTPKFGSNDEPNSVYTKSNLNWIALVEGFLTLYYISAAIMGLMMRNNSFLLFHIMLAFGFGSIFYLSLKSLFENEA